VTAITRILFISADPTNAARLRLGEEMREVRERLQLSRLRDRFELFERHCVRPADLTQAIFDTAPDIVHFSGHGSASALLFEGTDGKAFPVSPEALESTFGLFSDQIRCVVLNACFSENQAAAIARRISYVVGMRSRIGDRAAITFSVGFYKALMNGRGIEEAFQFGLAEIQLGGLREESTPVLLTNPAIRGRLVISGPQEDARGYRHSPSAPGRACIAIRAGQREQDTFALIDPGSYLTLQELLDDLYLKFLAKEYQPYTYGERWILAFQDNYYYDNLGETRVAAPAIWAATDRQPVHRIAPGWQQHDLAHYDIATGSNWSVCDLAGNGEFYGLATNNPDLVSYLLQNPKAIYRIRGQLHTIPISDWDESALRYNYVLGDWFSIGPGLGRIFIDPGIDLTDL
jgi:hypothetical protein